MDTIPTQEITPSAMIIYADCEEFIVLCPHCEMLHKHKQDNMPNAIRTGYCGKGNYTLGELINPRDLQRALKRRNAELVRKRKPNTITPS